MVPLDDDQVGDLPDLDRPGLRPDPEELGRAGRGRARTSSGAIPHCSIRASSSEIAAVRRRAAVGAEDDGYAGPERASHDVAVPVDDRRRRSG